MTKRTYKMVDGCLTEILDISGMTEEAKSAFVHQDTLEKPIKNLVTGEIFDSKCAYLKSVKRIGSRVVGNDWVGDTTPTGPEDKITDKMITEAMLKAEAIQRDPARRREWQAMERRKAEAQKQFMQRAAGAR